MKNKGLKIGLAVTAALAAFITGCIQLSDVIVPDQIETNSVAEFIIKGSVSPQTDYGPEGIAIAMLVPVEWDVTNTAEITLTTTNLQNTYGVADCVDEVMVPISDVSLAKPIDGYAGKTWAEAYTLKHGDLGNVNGDMEWVVFTNRDTKVRVSNIQPERVSMTVKAKFKTGPTPMICNLGFEFAGEAEGWEAVGFKDNLKTVTIKVGSGSVDYTKYPLTSTVPSAFRYGDFFSVVFASKVGDHSTSLDGEAEVFMCGTAVLEDGTKVELDRKDDSTCMRRTGQHTYQKYIFPTHYFGLPKGTKITDLYLYFTNRDGSKVEKGEEYPDLGFQFQQSDE